MCGIIGYTGSENAEEILINGLHSLEYRGYDSAGVSVSTPDGIKTVKCEGEYPCWKKNCLFSEI